MIWLIPGVLAAIGLVAVLAALARARREVARLQGAMVDLRTLGPPVQELRSEVGRLRAGVPELRVRTRPAELPAP